MCFGWYHSNLSNSSGQNRVPELHAKPACSQYVVLDCAPAPGATVNRDSLRRNAVQIEPPARNQIHAFIKHPNCVKGVFRRDVHSVARVEILLAHLVKRSGLLRPGRQRLRDRGQCGVLQHMLLQHNPHVNSRYAAQFLRSLQAGNRLDAWITHEDREKNPPARRPSLRQIPALRPPRRPTPFRFMLLNNSVNTVDTWLASGH